MAFERLSPRSTGRCAVRRCTTLGWTHTTKPHRHVSTPDWRACAQIADISYAAFVGEVEMAVPRFGDKTLADGTPLSETRSRYLDSLTDTCSLPVRVLTSAKPP